ncbi:MAG: hypothetical protein Q4A01_03860 [Coriobacteriales bacterium]|nr:hypothetical protein [Coriobacteriales bacterium]
MPSWNIHTAHVERLLGEESPESLGICHVDDFLFGNLVPDVYVGYMVTNPTRKIAYRDTHFSDPTFIPAPDASRFYNLYVRDKDANDVVLGAWTHLLCDHYYNLRTTGYIASIGVEPGEQTRIRKQADFDLFGRTLSISLVPRVTQRLVNLCADFPQYVVDEPDVYAAAQAQEAIVRKNQAQHVDGEPTYSLLNAAFFQSTYHEVCAVLREALLLHAAGAYAGDLGSIDS